MKNQAVVIYGTTVDRIFSVLDSGVLEGCNIVGVCTDELVLGDSAIKNVPIVQISDVNSLVVLLDENIPDAYRKVIEEKGILMWSLERFLSAVNATTDPEPVSDATEIQSSDESIEDISDDSSEDISVTASDDSNQEDVEVSEPSMPRFSDEQAEAMRGVLTTWLEKIYQAVNNTKNKDTSIYNINKELQKFKDGYYGKITSPIVSEMITLREDYKKSIDDCSKVSLTYEKQASYLECTIDQIDEILATYDVEVVDGKYSYNGKVIYPLTNNEATVPVSFEGEYPEIEKETYKFEDDVNTIQDCSSLEAFLVKVTSNVETLLKNNEALIKSVEIQNADLKKQIAVTDGLLIIPLLRKIIRMKLAFLNKREMLENFKEEAEAIYKEAYEYGIMYAESILTSLGVNIRSNIDDTYDPKYHRILKMQKILPEEAEKDKRIATFVTDCYVSDERVVAPAKVIVYKL